jgi:hypothetical protein
MKNTSREPDTEVEAISHILNNIYHWNYLGQSRNPLTEALKLLAENDRRILLYGLRRLLSIRLE